MIFLMADKSRHIYEVEPINYKNNAKKWGDKIIPPK